MQVPSELSEAAGEGDDVAITQRDVDGEQIVVIDFGRGVDASLDVVDDTAIVVAGDRQYEFEIPSDASEVTVNDGMLEIRS